MELVTGQQTTVLGHADLQFLLDPAPDATLAPGAVRGHREQLRGVRGTLQPCRQQQHPGAGRLFGPSQQRRRHGRHLPDRQSSKAAAWRPSNGYMPSYRVDHINYNNAAPWPIQPDGDGPALIRINTADYGNDAINWEASNVGGTPGQANLAHRHVNPFDSGQPGGPGPLEPDRGDQPHLDRLFRSAKLRGLLRHLSQRQCNSALRPPTSYADTTAVAGTNYTYTVGRQPRRLRQRPIDFDRRGPARRRLLRPGWTARTSRSTSASR